MNLKIVPSIDSNNLTHLDLTEVVLLIRETIPDYYGLLFDEFDGNFEIVRHLLSDTKSDLSYPTAALDLTDKVIGLIKTQILPDLENKSLYTLIKLLNQIDQAKRPCVLKILSNRPKPLPIMEKSTYISFISVSESYRGKGVAQLLLDSALNSAKESGINRISLHVSTSNTRAIRFYSKNQFICGLDNSHYFEMVKELL